MGRPPKEINVERCNRLKELLDDLKKQNPKENTQDKIAKKIPISQQVLSNIVNCKANLTEEIAKRIIELYPEYSLFWLLGLDRPKYAIDNSQYVIDKANSIYRKQQRLYDSMILFVNASGYDVQREKKKLIVRKENETVVLSDKEARGFYDELQNMIENYVNFHFAKHEKERVDNGKYQQDENH